MTTNRDRCNGFLTDSERERVESFDVLRCPNGRPYDVTFGCNGVFTSCQCGEHRIEPSHDLALEDGERWTFHVGYLAVALLTEDGE